MTEIGTIILASVAMTFWIMTIGRVLHTYFHSKESLRDQNLP